MAYMRIKSDNPDLGYILRKNPASGLTARTLRKGVLFGWYSPASPQIYNVWFNDADNDVSYPVDEEVSSFDYLNLTRYNSSLFVLNSLSILFNDAMSKLDERDVPIENQIFIGMVHVTSYSQRMIDFFAAHFNSFHLDSEILAKSEKSLSIKHVGTLQDLLNYTALLSFMLAICNEEEFYLEDAQLVKMIGIANKLNAPYFVRYLIKRNAIRGHELFDKVKESLETESIKLTFGDTWISRFDYVKSNLPVNMSIVDYGCGEGKYMTKLAPKLSDNVIYTAVDADEDMVAKVKNKADRKGMTNVNVIHSDGWIEGQGETVLLTEVLEHMEKDAATEFFFKVQKDSRVNTIVITVPNKDFNQYLLVDGFRHVDHKWEPTYFEFQEFIKRSVLPYFVYQIDFVGDTVDGCPVSLGVVLKRKST